MARKWICIGLLRLKFRKPHLMSASTCAPILSLNALANQKGDPILMSSDLLCSRPQLVGFRG